MLLPGAVHAGLELSCLNLHRPLHANAPNASSPHDACTSQRELDSDVHHTLADIVYLHKLMANGGTSHAYVIRALLRRHCGLGITWDKQHNMHSDSLD